MRKPATPEYSIAVKRAKTILVSLAMVVCLNTDAQGIAPVPNQGADHTFDQGSGLKISSLNSVQIDNLVLLGQVWGFLKYHHPAVTAGQKNWDYELLHLLPALLAAQDQRAAVASMVQWIDALGPVDPCTPCASDTGADLHLRAPLGWLGDAARLTPALSQRLQAIHHNRSVQPSQYYVSSMPQAGNPQFEHEPAYKNVPMSDAGFRLLAVFRFWNIIEYWFPYRDVIGEDWHQALRGAISSAVLAPNSAAYQRELMALIARVHDTHANLNRPGFRGGCLVKVKPCFRSSRRVADSSLPQPRPVEYTQSAPAVGGG